MYIYTGNISDLSHYIIENFVLNKGVAIDATLGNGHDTDFLSNIFDFVYAFDIQKQACDRYILNGIGNVAVINDSHHLLKKYINKNVDCIIYNLGFLPGGDKNITTKHNTSLESIKEGLDILNSNGIMVVCIYRGHIEGKIEESFILDYLKTLSKNEFGVMVHSYLNRDNIAPLLVVIEKK